MGVKAPRQILTATAEPNPHVHVYTVQAAAADEHLHATKNQFIYNDSFFFLVRLVATEPNF